MTDIQDRLLDAALPAIAFDGWIWGVFEQSANNVGISSFQLKRAFPNGVSDAAHYFSSRNDARMVETLRRNYQLSTMKIRERIATAVMVRLQQQLPNREAVRRLIGFYALPRNTAHGLTALYATCDAIWREAGDTSTDYNFYTKRIMLAGVLTSTVSVWLDDQTEDLAETKAFLGRRIENVMQIEKAKAKLREFCHI